MIKHLFDDLGAEWDLVGVVMEGLTLHREQGVQVGVQLGNEAPDLIFVHFVQFCIFNGFMVISV